MTIRQELDNFIDQLPNIPVSKRYWLIRTQSGSLYETFRETGFVALEHMDAPLSMLSAAKTAAADDELALRKAIRKQVIDEQKKKIDDTDEVDLRKSTLIANQIYKFTFEIKRGDIVIIPSYGSDLISFGEVSESHIASFTPEELRGLDTDAILKKRVKWLKDIPRIDLDPYLYKMFTAHQALNDVGNYADIIERSLKDFFILDNEAHLIINVQEEHEISAVDLFTLGTDLLILIDRFSGEYDLGISSRDLQVSVSLNSPGKIDLKSRVKKTTFVAGIILAVFGGGYKSEYVGNLSTDGIPGLIKAIDSFRDHEQQRVMKEKIFDTYKNKLIIKDPEDMNKLLKQFSENKDLPK